MGPRERILPADELSDLEHPRRHRRGERRSGNADRPLQLPVWTLVERGKPEGEDALGARPSPPRLRGRVDGRGDAVSDAARTTRGSAGGIDSERYGPVAT